MTDKKQFMKAARRYLDIPEVAKDIKRMEKLRAKLCGLHTGVEERELSILEEKHKAVFDIISLGLKMFEDDINSHRTTEASEEHRMCIARK